MCRIEIVGDIKFMHTAMSSANMRIQKTIARIKNIKWKQKSNKAKENKTRVC